MYFTKLKIMKPTFNLSLLNKLQSLSLRPLRLGGSKKIINRQDAEDAK